MREAERGRRKEREKRVDRAALKKAETNREDVNRKKLRRGERKRETEE